MSFLFGRANSDLPSTEFEMRQSRVRTPQFSLKVLSVLHELQAAPNTFCDGSDIKDIVKSMCENFNIDGDVKVQVLISLQQLVKQGLVAKICKNDNVIKFKLIGPIACVMRAPERTSARVEETKRVLKIFWKTLKTTTKPAFVEELKKKIKPKRRHSFDSPEEKLSRCMTNLRRSSSKGVQVLSRSRSRARKKRRSDDYPEVFTDYGETCDEQDESD